MKKKALIIFDEFWPIAGAPSIRADNIIRALADWDVEVLGGNYSSQNSPEIKGHFIRRPDDMCPLRLGIFFLKMYSRLIYLTFTRKYDLLLISIPKYELLYPLLILSPFIKCFHLDIRDSLGFLNYKKYFAHFLSELFAGILDKLFKFVVEGSFNFALRKAQRVTCANAGIADLLVKDQSKVVVVSNGVDVELFSPAQKSSRSGKLQIAYLGNFVEKDRFDYLLAALPVCKRPVVLHLIGEGRNKSNILTQLNQAKINYIDHGKVMHAQIPGILAKCQLGVIFREEHTKESIPVCIYEFCAMGLPVLCNPVGTMKDFVLSNNLGAIISSSEQLIKTLNEDFIDDQFLNNFAHLPELARQKFSLAASRENFHKVFAEEG
ncbi:MAG: glycosyltransferase [Deltaproteobacteria bacterium]|nr:glycosyltransferase [Deltaproteobacteria bacterium]